MRTVVHYKNGPYLATTETWIYGQIRNVQRYKAIVHCRRTENLDIYPTDHIRRTVSESEVSGSRKLSHKIRDNLSELLFLSRDRPCVVHAHYGPAGYRFLKFKRIFNLPLVTGFYGFDATMLPTQSPKWKKLYQKLFRRGELFLVEGAHMKQSLMSLGCPAGKIVIQHLGVDCDRITYVPRRYMESEEIKVLVTGSFREKKGIPYAIEAFGRVKKHNPELKFKLTIIGDSTGRSDEDLEKRRILCKIREYHLTDCTNMLGYKPHSVFLRELYKHHIFLSPSVLASSGDSEGGAPVSIIEASASGMPVISTMHCDIPEVVINEKSGYLVPERDVDALTEKLEFLVLNPGVCRAMGLVGRKHICSQYDVRQQVQRLEDIYDYVVKEHFGLRFTWWSF